MFSEIMLILKFLRCRLNLRIDQLAAGCHLGNFFQNNGIVYSLMGILAPCERSVILAENGRCRTIIQTRTVKFIRDKDTCIILISLIDIFICKIYKTRYLAVQIIGMGCPVAWNTTAGLCPACGPW